MWKNRLLCLGLVLCLLRRAVRPGGAKPLFPDASTRKLARAKRKRHPCGCLLSEVFSVSLQAAAVRLGFAGSGSRAVSGQFQIERRQIQGGVQGIQMGALHAMGGVYARADESSPAVHTGVPGSTDI